MLRRLLAAVLLIAPAAASAQDAGDGTVDVELFKPHTDAMGYFSMPGAATLGHLQIGVGFWTQYANDPLILVNNGERIAPRPGGSGDQGDGLIDDRLTGHIQLGMGMSRFFSLSLDVPIVLWQEGYQLDGLDNPQAPGEELITAAVSDVRVQPKLVVIDRDRLPIGMAVAVPVSVPSGNGGSFLGEEAFTVTPSLVLEFSDAPIHGRQYIFRSAVLLGYQVREEDRLRDVRVGNALTYGVAMGLHPAEPVEILAEFHGAVFGPQTSQVPAEVLGGLKFLLGRYVALNVGAGGAVLAGVGAPDYRVAFGLTVAPSFDPNARDSDKDGIVDGQDRCPKDPEDLDQFQEEDGCPEPDNDNDGILDADDRCPNAAEDEDGYRDEDGCPDSDNDKDGILDMADRCPGEPETANGYQDEDGCPDEQPVDDTDGDGYRDDVDRCPYDAEDYDQFRDEDGCPEEDNDNDGIVDVVDACPYDREIFNGVDDEDGCPDEGRVVVESNIIRITEKIYFEFGKAIIQDRSQSLIDEIAAVVLANENLRLIRIEGHTDDVGSDIANLKLSQQRADAVRAALIERQVAASRLDARGFGEMHPIESNATDQGRASNRRVEFIIVDQE